MGDSLFYHDFLSPDYFMDRWQQEMMRMNRMMHEMDSIKRLFFSEQYPELEKQKKQGKSLIEQTKLLKVYPRIKSE